MRIDAYGFVTTVFQPNVVITVANDYGDIIFYGKVKRLPLMLLRGKELTDVSLGVEGDIIIEIGADLYNR